MTFSTLSRLVANMTSTITLRGSKAYELIQSIAEVSNLPIDLSTLVCQIQKLTFNQRSMQYTQLPKGHVTFITFYGDKSYHPRILFTRTQNKGVPQVTKQPLLSNTLIQVTSPAEYKILLNRLDVNHEAYVLMIYQEDAQTQTRVSLSKLIEFKEAVDQPYEALTNTIDDLEEALDHLDSTIEEFSNEGIYNFNNTLETALPHEGSYELDL